MTGASPSLCGVALHLGQFPQRVVAPKISARAVRARMSSLSWLLFPLLERVISSGARCKDYFAGPEGRARRQNVKRPGLLPSP